VGNGDTTNVDASTWVERTLNVSYSVINAGVEVYKIVSLNACGTVCVTVLKMVGKGVSIGKSEVTIVAVVTMVWTGTVVGTVVPMVMVKVRLRTTITLVGKACVVMSTKVVAKPASVGLPRVVVGSIAVVKSVFVTP